MKTVLDKEKARESSFARLCGQYMPFTVFTAKEWANFRGDAAVDLSFPEIKGLRSIGDPLDLAETEHVYLPLVRLITMYMETNTLLAHKRGNFFQKSTDTTPLKSKTPFIIGIAGPVSVGKSTSARILQQLLQRSLPKLKVDLVTTDGFLYSNAVLKERGKMQRKGFPESYDTKQLLKFLSAVKSGVAKVSAPLYSHLTYDVLPDQQQIIDQPDILILEGVNVLQVNTVPGRGLPFVSDFFDFSIYIDADPKTIFDWYIDRFMSLRQTAFHNPKSYFRAVADVPEDEALAIAKNLWESINLPNLKQNILPTRPRADVILRKGTNHLVELIALRKL